MLEHYRSQVADARGAGLAGVGEQARLGATIRALLVVVDDDFDPRRTSDRYEGRARPSARSPKPGATTAPGWAISSSATRASVVSSSAATDAACSRLSRVTRTGSTMPFS